MYDDATTKLAINNEFDYSNIVSTKDIILYLAKYCDNVYKKLKLIIDEEEEQNKKLKAEYKKYMYKKTYGFELEIYVKYESYNNNMRYNDYDTFSSAAEAGQLNNITGLEIKLDLSFGRGTGEKIEKHENIFKISIYPYNVKFIRKSNYNDSDMNQIENQINTILKEYKKINTVFCTKEDNI